MIAEENKRILDYIRGGASDRQICEWLGLSYRNYRKRISTLQKQDMENMIARQTPEAVAFTLERITDKIHNLEIHAAQIAYSNTEGWQARIEAMKLMRQLHEDELGLFFYGANRFLDTHGIPGREGTLKALRYRAAFGEGARDADAADYSGTSTDSSPVF